VAAAADPVSATLRCQAISMRNKLLIETTVVSVPSVNIYSSKQVLKARLAAASAFENGF
jgi:hypothetical protein